MLENSGKSYKTTSGTSQAFETILKSSGVNTVRQRLWVTPSDGNYNLAYNIKLAQRAKAAGLGVYLDMHFSDTCMQIPWAIYFPIRIFREFQCPF
jgi:arabinogalactan endo-1,4-beta-galactosidase